MAISLNEEYRKIYQGKEIKKIRESIENVRDSSLMKTVILVALDQVGKVGKTNQERGLSNATRYAEILDEEGLYNGPKQGLNWCDIFVDYLYTVASGSVERAREITYQTGDYGAGVPYSYEYYSSHHAIVSSQDKPKIGDQIFLRTRTSPNAHTGIVVARDDQYVYTIEGNTVANPNIIEDEDVGIEQREISGQGVYLKRYRRDSEKIVGYGRPNLTDTERLSPSCDEEVNNYIISIYMALNRNLTPIFPDFADISDFPKPENLVGESLSFLLESVKNNIVVRMRVAQDNRDYVERKSELSDMFQEEQDHLNETRKGVLI